MLPQNLGAGGRFARDFKPALKKNDRNSLSFNRNHDRIVLASKPLEIQIKI